LCPEPDEWPEITVMVAARNEEANIKNCLLSLFALDYPKDRLHIIVGDDQSIDQTSEIVQSLITENPNLRLIYIEDDSSGLKAKARVMAQMDKYARGEYFLITDADVRVKPQWAKFLIRHMKPETGVASGTTMVTGKDMYTVLQGIDLAHFMGMLNMISYTGVPATAVGNNMIIRSNAYWDTGGYASIKFSITEDYKLYSEVCKKGWKWDNIMIPEVLAYSDSTKGFLPLLHQRKRWLSGGRELPFYWWILFGVFGMYYFVMPVLLFLHPLAAMVLFLVKIALQILSLNRIHKMLGEKPPGMVQHLLYEVYLYVITISTALFFLMPFKTIWKGRKY
jgi:cellulose synthase/poly-beta-1,6-N-acetylglucosamine synthase-like glycosyltransferase